ncbi:WD40 repeat-like protein [Serendipita vermifera]|nr:WD40 repeat-like protein [Serendipita vermifera]
MTDTLQSFDTFYPADSVEFCPSLQYSRYFVCGTYKLEEQEKASAPTNLYDEADESSISEVTSKAQTRVGRLFLMYSKASGQFDQVFHTDLPAILDLKWSRHDLPRLAIADAVGCLRFYGLSGCAPDDTVPRASLKELQVLQCTSPNKICLSLDWSDRNSQTISPKVVASISDGTICVVEDTDRTYQLTNTWHAHEHEPWIAAWNYWNISMVYTGGDDLSWKAWDMRTDLSSPLFINKRSFDGGVTSIQSHPYYEHYVAVGSYDEHVRLFDIRRPQKPVETVHVGGGAWRVKWHPFAERKQDLLVACMHDGFKVVRFSGEALGGHSREQATHETSFIVRRFDEHTSLAYGADWCYSEQLSNDKTLIASCSFYDHLLKTWSG